MKAPLILFMAAALVLGALQLLHQVTAGRISAHTLAQAKALTQSLSTQLGLNEAHGQTLDWPDLPGLPEHLGLRSPRPIEWLPEAQVLFIPSTSQRGYAGDIELLVAVSAAREVLAVGLIQHRETPGIGDRIEPERSNWLAQLTGAKAPLAHRPHGHIDRLSGATITTQAVLEAVNQALAWSAQHPQLFDLEANTP